MEIFSRTATLVASTILGEILKKGLLKLNSAHTTSQRHLRIYLNTKDVQPQSRSDHLYEIISIVLS